MRHGKKFNHLSRKAGHRRAMLKNMASSLILNKRITTTLAKAKELRKYVEPIITKSKADDMNARRVAFRYLQDKYAVQELFSSVSGKVGERNGGYTRIIRLGNRLGDNAETALIELVDFNDLYTQGKSKTTTKKRRRRGGSKTVAETTEATKEVEEVEAVVAEPTDEATETKEEVTVEDATPETEASADDESSDAADTGEDNTSEDEKKPQ